MEKVEISEEEGGIYLGVQVVAIYIEDAVPAGAVVLESDLRTQLHELFFRKFLVQARVEIAEDVGWCRDHGVGKLKYRL
jgi:hypothetical protein